jgi:DNA-binding transcriptional LysR family regulator
LDGDINRTRHRGQGLHNLVSAGLGIMLAPEHMPVAPGTVVRPIADIEFRRDVELFVVAGRQYSPALNAFVKTCRSTDWRAQFAPSTLQRVAPKNARFEAVARCTHQEAELRLTA